MPKRMLIDANHPEETRVVVLDGQKVEEFDFESASKRPLKGNIYLAKVTRVEPSLQAAFVEYGGNRQGFLAFSEIHPDYYQIPVSDREALLAEAEAEARRRQEDDFESFDIAPGEKPDSDDDEEEDGEETADNTRHDDDNGQDDGDAPVALHDDASESGVEFGISAPSSSQPDTGEDAPEQNEGEQTGAETGSADAAPADAAGGEAALSAQRPSQRWMRKRHYKIQEVIKRRQIILVQVVKEERGNKGAALTTYLSLAGRYCVLMPNTPRGGGISRKITNAADRKRLKSAAQSLNLPEGMGLIIRTAGGNRTKLEIKRDYEYLLRMWDTIREQTLQSVAPSCVYEEGDLVKRAIRDLYNKDVEEVLVEGEAGYRNAKDFMRMLMPSHAKNVKPYKETVPLFQRFHIEAQLDAMFSPIVTLKSGGYIVIDQTEALVAIDVNSGRATKEHSIEDTATKTNLEAADEVGRQLRLRDLAGLIVVDFIDMEDSRNDRLVEKRMMNAVKNDRARIQVGKISQFGLLEMSRQRLRAGVVAGSTLPCPHCGGSGLVRSVESTSLRVLRGIEEEAQKQRAESLLVHVATDAAIYTLNQKRAEITRVEAEYDITIAFEPTNELKAGDFTIDRIGQRDPDSRPRAAVTLDMIAIAPEEDEPEIEEEESAAEEEAAFEAEAEGDDSAEAATSAEQANTEGGRRRRRRRRGRGRDRGALPDSTASETTESTAPAANREDAGSEPDDDADDAGDEADENGSDTGENGADGVVTAEGAEGDNRRRRRRRRRGRRGGRDRNAQPFDGSSSETVSETADETPSDGIAEAPRPMESYAAESVVAEPVAIAVVAPIDVYEDRFGRIDEIDTTPQDYRPAPAQSVYTQPVSLMEPVREAPVASQPVWSLSPEPENKPKSEPVKEPAPTEPAPIVLAQTPAPQAPETAQPVVQQDTAAAVEEKPAEDTGPSRKGWWQRTFRTE